MIKKLFIFLSFALFCFICFSQNSITQTVFEKKINHIYDANRRISFFIPSPDTIPLIDILDNTNKRYNGWFLNGDLNCYTCASFYYRILRSKNIYRAEDNNSYYYYYFYFFSNSKKDGKYTGTYISGLRIYNEEILLLEVPYVLIEPNKIIYAAWVRSKDPSLSLYFDVKNITIY